MPVSARCGLPQSLDRRELGSRRPLARSGRKRPRPPLGVRAKWATKSRESRGYGVAHKRLREKYPRLIDRGAVVLCARCRRRILPGTPFDLDHGPDRLSISAPRTEAATAKPERRTVPPSRTLVAAARILRSRRNEPSAATCAPGRGSGPGRLRPRSTSTPKSCAPISRKRRQRGRPGGVGGASGGEKPVRLGDAAIPGPVTPPGPRECCRPPPRRREDARLHAAGAWRGNA
jgi:hypothetical protein